MARKKVNLAYIANDAVRRATFKKRRKGLMKKVRELATLCDVPACIIVYGPHEARPEVWPSEEEARRMLIRFRQLPELEQSKKMVNQEQFLHQRVKKLLDQFNKHERELREIEMGVIMYECMDGRGLHDVGAEDVMALHYFVEMRIKALYEVMEAASAAAAGEQAAAAADTDGRNKEIILDQAQAQAQRGLVAPPPAMDGLQAAGRPNWYPEMFLQPNEQVFARNNGGASSSNGGLGDMMQPYLDNIGSQWTDPNLFNF